MENNERCEGFCCGCGMSYSIQDLTFNDRGALLCNDCYKTSKANGIPIREVPLEVTGYTPK